MGETMRQLLAARQSEAMHSQALRVSKVALWVSVVALVLGIPGAFYAIQAYVSPSPTEVYFRTTIPVSVQNSVKLEQQEQKTAPQKQQKQSLSPN
jgi:cell division protein FtsX